MPSDSARSAWLTRSMSQRTTPSMSCTARPASSMAASDAWVASEVARPSRGRSRWRRCPRRRAWSRGRASSSRWSPDFAMMTKTAVGGVGASAAHRGYNIMRNLGGGPMTDASDPPDGRVGADRLDGQWAVITGSSKGIGLNRRGVRRRRGERDARRPRRGRPGRRGQEPAGPRRGGPDRPRPPGRHQRRGLDRGAVRPHPRGAALLDVFVANAGAGVVTAFLDIPLDEWEWLGGAQPHRHVPVLPAGGTAERLDPDRPNRPSSSSRRSGPRAPARAESPTRRPRPV